MHAINRRRFLAKSAAGMAGLSAGNIFGSGMQTSRTQEDPAVGYYDHPAFPVIDQHIHIAQAMHSCFPSYLDTCGVRFVISHGYWHGIDADVAAVTDIKNNYPDRFAAFYVPNFGTTVTDAYLTTTLPAELERFMIAGGANALGLKLWRDIGATVQKSNGQPLQLTDPLLNNVYAKAQELGAIISIHVCGSCQYTRDAVIARFTGIKFVDCHWGNWVDNQTALRNSLNRFPNVMVDISPAGGWPTAYYSQQVAHDFMVEFQDRLMLGTDATVENRTDCGSLDWWTCWYQAYYRFLQTWDVDFTTNCDVGPWTGVGLGEDVLRKMLWSNAYNYYGLNRLLPDLPTGAEKGVTYLPAADSRVFLLVPGYQPAAIDFSTRAFGASARLSLYDLNGALVKSFTLPPRLAGPHSISWDGRTKRGGRVAAGVYLARLQVGPDALAAKLVLTR